MKKTLNFLCLLFVSSFAFGQSVVITPSQTTNQSNTGGENINVTANSNSLGIYGRRFNGTFVAKMPILNGNELFRVSAGGWYTSNNTDESQHAAIKFNATENWNFNGSGTKISFTTTRNGGTSQVERMVINHDGKIGIGNLSPVGKLHINHLATNSEAHLHLQSTGASSSIIKASSTAVGSEWDNHFVNSTSAASNLVYWTNSVNSTTPLILTGQGDAVVERNATIGGYTKLGSDASAPKIKMKTLTSVTGATQGAANSPIMSHGVTASKIISVSVFVDFGLNFFIPPGFLAAPGEQYDYQITGDRIETFNHPTNSGNILSKPIKVVITYIE